MGIFFKQSNEYERKVALINIIVLLVCFVIFICWMVIRNNNSRASTADYIFPYVATYSSHFNQDVSDDKVQVVLNSLKAWEMGDMKDYRQYFADTVTFNSADGTTSTVVIDDLMASWSAYRHDTLTSMKIEVIAWNKQHAIDQNHDLVNLWFKVRDEYKSGKISESDIYEDYQVEKNKIIVVTQYKRGH